jgi:hypothetical protein
MGEQIMKSTRLAKKSSILIWPQTENICEIENEGIVAFLPGPDKSRRGSMIFPFSSSKLHVC